MATPISIGLSHSLLQIATFWEWWLAIYFHYGVMCSDSFFLGGGGFHFMGIPGG